MPEFHVGVSRLAAVAVLGLAGSAMAQAPAPALIQIDAGGASVPMEPYYSFLLPGEEQPGVMSGLRFVRRSAKEGRDVIICTDGQTRGDDLATLRLHGRLAPVLSSWVRMAGGRVGR